MKLTNNFITEIGKIIMSMVNIQKMGIIIIEDPKLYEPFFYEKLNDYLSISYKIRELRKIIESLDIENNESYSSKKHYKEQIILLSNDILEFNKIVNICTEYQKEALNYYYFINRSLREEHATIINMISNATKQNMNGFDIEELRNMLVKHITKTNEFIIGHKINEPNLFNQIKKE